MKRVWNWIAKIILAGLVLLGLAPVLLMLLLVGMLYFGDWEAEVASWNDVGESALLDVGLTSVAQYVSRRDLSIDGVLTAVILDEYDNYDDKTDLRQAVMAHAATAEGWHMEPVMPDEYAAWLAQAMPEAAFLQPVNLDFDAWYAKADGMYPDALPSALSKGDSVAFFDQETGLTVHISPQKKPSAGKEKLNGLTIPHDGWVYELETHGGFHGDGDTLLCFIVPEEERAALENELVSHADWQQGTVSHAEYAVLQAEKFYEIPPLFPQEGVDFDWWCYVDTYARMYPDKQAGYEWGSDDFPAVMQAAGAHWAGNWLVALYDADTGLFIYYEYDS